ncbi:MAG: aminotransferase class I/II-fold pyridoxal phosphate-dependent enzyme, partial [Bdellovibrionales bacterium]|nr:aminotransferase class I/II-fold pyridoxal phosphate-dependent enzyme [Bdellovibrionales bacterium]
MFNLKLHSLCYMEWLHSDYLDDLNRLKIELVRGGRELLDLSMINPDLPPPRILLDKLTEACVKPFNHRYAVSRGIRKLREAFSLKYSKSFAIELDPESQVCVTMGTKDALPNTLTTLKQMGFVNRALVATPTYPPHLAALRIAEYEFDFFCLDSDEQQMQHQILSALDRGRYSVLLLNFPNNPTGIYVNQT